MSKLCTLQQVKDFLKITSSDDDNLINSLIDAATAAIQLRYSREFVPQVVQSRIFKVIDYFVDLAPYDLAEVTNIELNPEEDNPRILSSSDYVLLPLNGAEGTSTYLAIKISNNINIQSNFYNKFGFAQIKITGTWGAFPDVSTVADDINQAAIETVASWLDRGATQAAGYETLGEPHRGILPTALGWDIPISAHRKLQYYSRNLGVY